MDQEVTCRLGLAGQQSSDPETSASRLGDIDGMSTAGQSPKGAWSAARAWSNYAYPQARLPDRPCVNRLRASSATPCSTQSQKVE